MEDSEKPFYPINEAINRLLEAGIDRIIIYPISEVGHDEIPKLIVSYKQAEALYRVKKDG